MKEEKSHSYINIGLHKGEMDFGVNCSVEDLTLEEMDELRIMVCVAIQQAQNMWSRKRESLQTNICKKK